jgi:hypothetical protein
MGITNANDQSLRCAAGACGFEDKYVGEVSRTRLQELIAEADKGYSPYIRDGGKLSWHVFAARYILVRLNADKRMEAVATAQAFSKLMDAQETQRRQAVQADDGDLGTAWGGHYAPPAPSPAPLVVAYQPDFTSADY